MNLDNKCYMELDAAVDRVLKLSQWHGDLSRFGEDKEWLRNELEQICHLPCDIGPLPKWNIGYPKESGWYLCTFADRPGLHKPFVNAAFYRASEETWDDVSHFLYVVGWMAFPEPMRSRED